MRWKDVCGTIGAILKNELLSIYIYIYNNMYIITYKYFINISHWQIWYTTSQKTNLKAKVQILNNVNTTMTLFTLKLNIEFAVFKTRKSRNHSKLKRRYLKSYNCVYVVSIKLKPYLFDKYLKM